MPLPKFPTADEAADAAMKVLDASSGSRTVELMNLATFIKDRDRAMADKVAERIVRLYKALGLDADKCSRCPAAIWWIPPNPNKPDSKPQPFNMHGVSHYSDCIAADSFRKKP